MRQQIIFLPEVLSHGSLSGRGNAPGYRKPDSSCPPTVELNIKSYYNDNGNHRRGRGGTGRRAGLRIQWGNLWRFESSRPHHPNQGDVNQGDGSPG